MTTNNPSTARHGILTAIAFTVGLLLWLTFTVDEARIFGFQAKPVTRDGAQLVLGFGGVLLGGVLGSSYRELERLRQAGQRSTRWPVLIRRVNYSIDFKVALIAAPLVYALLINTVGDIRNPGLLLLSLEHGFVAPFVASVFHRSVREETSGNRTASNAKGSEQQDEAANR